MFNPHKTLFSFIAFRNCLWATCGLMLLLICENTPVVLLHYCIEVYGFGMHGECTCIKTWKCCIIMKIDWNCQFVIKLLDEGMKKFNWKPNWSQHQELTNQNPFKILLNWNIQVADRRCVSNKREVKVPQSTPVYLKFMTKGHFHLILRYLNRLYYCFTIFVFALRYSSYLVFSCFTQFTIPDALMYYILYKKEIHTPCIVHTSNIRLDLIWLYLMFILTFVKYTKFQQLLLIEKSPLVPFSPSLFGVSNDNFDKIELHSYSIALNTIQVFFDDQMP